MLYFSYWCISSENKCQSCRAPLFMSATLWEPVIRPMTHGDLRSPRQLQAPSPSTWHVYRGWGISSHFPGHCPWGAAGIDLLQSLSNDTSRMGSHVLGFMHGGGLCILRGKEAESEDSLRTGCAVSSFAPRRCGIREWPSRPEAKCARKYWRLLKHSGAAGWAGWSSPQMGGACLLRCLHTEEGLPENGAPSGWA